MDPNVLLCCFLQCDYESFPPFQGLPQSAAKPTNRHMMVAWGVTGRLRKPPWTAESSTINLQNKQHKKPLIRVISLCNVEIHWFVRHFAAHLIPGAGSRRGWSPWRRSRRRRRGRRRRRRSLRRRCRASGGDAAAATDRHTRCHGVYKVSGSIPDISTNMSWRIWPWHTVRETMNDCFK